MRDQSKEQGWTELKTVTLATPAVRLYFDVYSWISNVPIIGHHGLKHHTKA